MRRRTGGGIGLDGSYWSEGSLTWERREQIWWGWDVKNPEARTRGFIEIEGYQGAIRTVSKKTKT
jgi:hypothetical protein